MDARNVTLDFERMGHTARAINQVIPFFAVSINGAQRFAEMHNPDKPHLYKKAMLRGFLGMTIPSLILWFLHKDDDEYKNVESWKRDLFWLIPSDLFGLRSTFGPFIRIPKPPIWGQFYGSAFERWADSLYSHNPAAFEDFGKTLWQQTVPDATIQTLKPILEASSNYNSFTDRPIESDAMKKLSPVNRYHPSTSETAKAMSRGFKAMGIDISPVKVEHLMLGYTAGLGRFAITTTEEALGLRSDRPAMGPTEVPIVRAFATPETPFISTNSNRFRKRLLELEQRHNDAMIGVDVPKGPNRKNFGLTEEEAADLLALRKLNKSLSEIRKLQSEVEHSTLLTRDEKRKQLDELSHTREDTLRENKDLFTPGTNK